jgi:hypothetical protein
LETKKKTGGEKPAVLHCIILIPHRDGAGRLEEYRHSLFASGLAGAFSFPAAAPLALVSRPFRGEELKALAGELRALTRQEGGGGKFRSAGTLSAACPLGGFNFFGLSLEPWGDLPSLGGEKVVYRFPALCLCAALLVPGESPGSLPAPPELSFRAAMIANLAICPLSQGEAGYSFAWKTGRPVWLPAYRKARNPG